jgi:hypothetical protein
MLCRGSPALLRLVYASQRLPVFCLLCAHRQAKIGPGQLGLAGGAILFILVFVLVSSGDFATTNR